MYMGANIMMIPKFLLRKLYVKGSLKNIDSSGDGNPDSVSFQIKNTLANGTVTGVEYIKIDDEEIPLDSIEVSLEDKTLKLSDVTPENAFPIKVRVTSTWMVKGKTLSPGEHKLDISIKTKEAGKLAFDVKDSI